MNERENLKDDEFDSIRESIGDGSFRFSDDQSVVQPNKVLGVFFYF